MEAKGIRCLIGTGRRDWALMGMLPMALPTESGVVRPARVDDAAAIARVHVATWRSTYPGLLPDQYLLGLSAQAHAAQWRDLLKARRRAFVAEADTRAADGLPATSIVGFATCGRQRSHLAQYDGEFCALYVHEDAQGQGYGRRLMTAMAADMARGGMRSACVWVLRGNPACWFYERLGGRRVGEKPLDFAGTTLSEIAYGWDDLTALSRRVG